MSWNFSTGFKDAFLNRDTSFTTVVNITGSTVTFTATGIADSGNGLAGIAVDDWVTVAEANTAANEVRAKCISSAAGALGFGAATFTVDASASPALLTVLSGGSFKELMQNSVLYLYSGTRPTTADAVENGTLLAKLTADGNAFAFDTSLNGLNFGNLTSSVLGIGDDPATATTEVWSGDGIVAGTATWGRFHANGGAVGADAAGDYIRMDGNVTTTTGGDLVMSSGRDIVVGVPAVLSEMNVGIFSIAYS